MADEQRVYQGGVTVASELAADGQRVYQVGITVPALLAAGGQRVYQVGITVPAWLVPSPPSGLAASASGTEVTLTWTNNYMDRTGLRIQSSPDDANWALVANVALDAVTYLHEDQAPGVLIYYRIAAVVDEIVGTYSSSVSVLLPSAGNNIMRLLPFLG